MSKNLHNMDDIFKDAYDQFGEDPSPDVWDNLNARLDKKDAVSFRRTSKNWKRVAILLSLVLIGFIIYESGIVNGHSIRSKENIPITSAGKKADKNPVNKDEAINHNTSSPNKTFKEETPLGKNNSEVVKKNYSRVNSKDKNILDLTDHAKNYTSILNRYTALPHRKEKTSRKDPDETTTANLPVLGDHEGQNQKSSDYPVREMIFPDIERNYSSGIVMKQLNDVRRSQLPEISETKPINKSKIKSHFLPQWTVSGFLSSDHPGYRLDKDGPSLVRIKEHEEHKPSFSGGILVTRQIKKRLGLQTGLIYSKTSIAISPQKIYASQNQAGGVSYKYVTSSGYAYIKPGFASTPSPGDSLSAENAQHSLQYIIAPLFIKYNLIDTKKLIFSPAVGIAGNFLTNAKIETEVSGPSNREHILINKLKGIRPFNWSVIADLAIAYPVNKSLLVNLHPFFSYALSPITRNNDVETFPYNFGIGGGISYRF